MTDDERIEAAAKAIAAQQGIDWDDLPDTNQQAAPRRSPDCCNRLDCKEDVREAALAAALALAGEKS